MENIDIDLNEIDIANVDSVLTGPQGPQGIQGPAGEPGEDGITPVITVANTITLEPDTPAYVNQDGTTGNVVLTFGIPRGSNANCLSVPTIVNELPEVADPNTFYFVPITYTDTIVTSSTVNMNVTTGMNGRINQLEILGEIEQDTPPATPVALSGVITFTVNADDYTVDLGDIYLAKVTTHQDKIYNDGNDFYLHREIGYIENYSGQDLTGVDYVSTSGTLTNGDEVYYVLQEATDTLITDDNLTNSLRAVRNILLSTGSSTISTSANVTANITIGWHEVDPHHQYKKYVYMIDTANFEEIS